MKDQLQIHFDLLRADNKLMQKWLRLIHEYRESDLNNIILLLDGDGKIVSIANPSGNCFEELFMKVDRLM
jgi:hypothetical protein